jgi:excisionase family DNA binding protein
MNGDGYLTIKDVMKIFQISERTVRNWMDKKGLPSLIIGGSLRFVESEIRNWAEGNKEDNK